MKKFAIDKKPEVSKTYLTTGSKILANSGVHGANNELEILNRDLKVAAPKGISPM